MLELIIHPSPEWPEEARQDVFSFVCRLFGIIPEQYPYIQMQTDPTGLIHLIIGEGMLPDYLRIETAAVSTEHDWIPGGY